MNQREEILQAWDRYSAHAYPSSQLSAARAFFKLVQDRPDLCWDDLTKQLRTNYYDGFEPVSTVLISTDNALVMYNATRVADPSNPREASALKSFIRQSDPDKHQVSMAGLALQPAMQADLLSKPKLPQAVAAALNPNTAQHAGNVGVPKAQPAVQPAVQPPVEPPAKTTAS